MFSHSIQSRGLLWRQVESIKALPTSLEILDIIALVHSLHLRIIIP